MPTLSLVTHLQLLQALAGVCKALLSLGVSTAQALHLLCGLHYACVSQESSRGGAHCYNQRMQTGMTEDYSHEHLRTQ